MTESGKGTLTANFRVGRYNLEKPLGEGGMAEVWLGRNVVLGMPAAIKFLNRSYAGVNDIEQRFLNEGRRQGGLSHPNIIKVYGFEYVEGRSFLILQYIDGESLADLLDRRASPGTRRGDANRALCSQRARLCARQ